MEEDEVRMTVRLPKSLREWLEGEARSDQRSIHGQIIHLLLMAQRRGKRG